MLDNKPKPKRKTLHVKKGDKVVVITGQYKSDVAHEVMKVDGIERRVVIEGVNMRWITTKPTQQTPRGDRARKECTIHASNVMLYDEEQGKGVRKRPQEA